MIALFFRSFAEKGGKSNETQGYRLFIIIENSRRRCHHINRGCRPVIILVFWETKYYGGQLRRRIARCDASFCSASFFSRFCTNLAIARKRWCRRVVNHCCINGTMAVRVIKKQNFSYEKSLVDMIRRNMIIIIINSQLTKINLTSAQIVYEASKVQKNLYLIIINGGLPSNVLWRTVK